MAVLVLVLLGLALLAVGVWRLVLLIPGGRVAQVDADVQPPYAFELRYLSTTARAYRLALRIRLRGRRWGSSTSTGVVCRLRVTVGGRVLAEETLGFGSDLPRAVDRSITQGYRLSETRSGSEVVRSATHVLARIPHCPAGTEIVAKGTFETGPHTELSMLELFLGR